MHVGVLSETLASCPTKRDRGNRRAIHCRRRQTQCKYMAARRGQDKLEFIFPASAPDGPHFRIEA